MSALSHSHPYSTTAPGGTGHPRDRHQAVARSVLRGLRRQARWAIGATEHAVNGSSDRGGRSGSGSGNVGRPPAVNRTGAPPLATGLVRVCPDRRRGEVGGDSRFAPLPAPAARERLNRKLDGFRDQTHRWRLTRPRSGGPWNAPRVIAARFADAAHAASSSLSPRHAIVARPTRRHEHDGAPVWNRRKDWARPGRATHRAHESGRVRHPRRVAKVVSGGTASCTDRSFEQGAR